MPKRMMTTRCQKIEPKDVDDVFVDPTKNFEFDFRDGQAIFAQPPSHRTRTQDVYEISPVGPKRQCTAPEFRLPTRGNGPIGAVDKRLQLTKVEDTWIGVAFGSPTHPLSGWTDNTSPVSSTRGSHTDTQPSQQTPSKWKKIGGIFRAKSPPQIQPLKNTVGDEFDPEQYKLGIPLRRVPWRNPRSPLPIPVIERESIDIINPSDLEALVSQDEEQRDNSSTRDHLPTLEIEIPSTEMERYSIMFREINGERSPCVSLRHERTVPNLRDLQGDHISDLSLVPIPIPIKKHKNNTSKIPYSLFPLPPKTRVFDYLPNAKATEAMLHVRSSSAPAVLSPRRNHLKTCEDLVAGAKKCSQITNQINPRRASITEGEILQPTTYNAQAPGRITSKPKLTVRTDSIGSVNVPVAIHSHHLVSDSSRHIDTTDVDKTSDSTQLELDKPLPLRPRRAPSSDVSTSPEDNTVVSDKNDAPWVSEESPNSSASSRTSVDDEIFFDIKSFRGSKDQGISQFVISRPDSTAVQHARSMSRKIKIKEPGSMPFDLMDDSQPANFCMPPDLQAAEYYCLGSEPKIIEQTVRLSMFDEVIAEVERLASPSEAVSPLSEKSCITEVTNLEPKSIKPTISITARLQGHSIAVPSPIIERSEENTPVSATRKSPVGRLKHIASQASHSSSSPLSFSSSIWDVPPPVPEKDTKYLPVSKYSVHRKPLDEKKAPQLCSHTPSKSVVERPTKINHPQSGTKSDRSGRKQHEPAKTSMLSRQNDLDQSTIAVKVRPTAECSVAHTISLRRKPSHQILVSRSSSSGRGRKNNDSSRHQPQKQQRQPRSQLQEEAREGKLRWSTEKRAMSPVVVLDVPKGHKPGASVNVVVESI